MEANFLLSHKGVRSVEREKTRQNKLFCVGIRDISMNLYFNMFRYRNIYNVCVHTHVCVCGYVCYAAEGGVRWERLKEGGSFGEN